MACDLGGQIYDVLPTLGEPQGPGCCGWLCLIPAV